MLRVIVVALVLLVAAMVLLPRPSQLARNVTTEVATVLPEYRPLPDFELVDHLGEPFRNDALSGNFSMLFFGFTNCPDVCPLTLQVLANVRAEINTREPETAPDVVFVSVDPNRDTADRIDSYLSNFDAEFRGATGSDDALAPVLKMLGVTVHKQELPGESYNVAHNSTIYFISPRAELIAISSAPHDAATLASDYAKIRRRYGAARRTPTP